MSLAIAYLGPSGTYSEMAALAYSQVLQSRGIESHLYPCPTIAHSLRAIASQQTQVAVVPVENSIEGSVTVTLDTLWQLDELRIQQALVLPISHALLSYAKGLDALRTVYSHPQALAQCQVWLETSLPNAQVIPTHSTTEALQYLEQDETVAAIASQRAAQLYHLPTLVHPINDHPDNCTRFWALSLESSPGGSHSSLAFSLPANLPGSLAKVLQIFAQRDINLSRIESRPTKRSLGEYLFFTDIEADVKAPLVQAALEELRQYTETLKIFGSYTILPVNA
ncbi:prephenate dehydratase [Oscillatoria sp. FACHB-1407]|uniref:prephenate dehydratase n=1 Tax=Oscillatoria sp. FACHB-1407 TaxID=2692847 RepID=UPI001687F787|nr:prephenate dehydratase [Oscillatoria sp. FACHB-1407]MBD2465314.1 prephenate dehydratase [Oscillatoria sp. FACHB-1407]